MKAKHFGFNRSQVILPERDILCYLKQCKSPIFRNLDVVRIQLS